MAGGAERFGSNNGSEGRRAAQSFLTIGAGTLNLTVQIGLKTFGSPSDNVVITLEDSTGGGGAPSGTPLSTGTIAAASLTGSNALYSITMDTAFSMSAAHTYFIVESRSGTLDGTNHYGLALTTPVVYVDGTVWYQDGATSVWTSYNGTEESRLIVGVDSAAGANSALLPLMGVGT